MAKKVEENIDFHPKILAAFYNKVCNFHWKMLDLFQILQCGQY